MTIYWANMPCEGESRRMSKLFNPYYETALKKNLTKEFFKELKIRAKSKQNLIVSIFGPPGTGKSYAMIFIAEKMANFNGTELTLENWCFTITDLLKVVEKLKITDIFGLDEQIHTSGYGSMIEKNILDNVEMTVRAHKLSFFFSSPKHIIHNYHYYLETWQMGSNKKWDWDKPIEQQWKYTKSIIFDHKDIPIGYVITGKPTNEDFLEKYEKKKSKFIEEIRKRRGSTRYKHILDRAYEIVEDDEFLKRWALCKTKRLKRLLVVVALKGEMMSIEETNMLLDYIDYITNFEPDLRSKIEKFKKLLTKKS